MKSVLDQIQKRRCYPVEIDGETISVKSLSFHDGAALSTLENGSDQIIYAIGAGLLDSDGKPVFERNDGETPAAFVAKVKAATPDMPAYVAITLSEAIRRISKPPSLDSLVKNSEQTDVQDS